MHNKFFELNLYQKNATSAHHWRANLARVSRDIDLAFRSTTVADSAAPRTHPAEVSSTEPAAAMESSSRNDEPPVFCDDNDGDDDDEGGNPWTRGEPYRSNRYQSYFFGDSDGYKGMIWRLVIGIVDIAGTVISDNRTKLVL